ncbi:MAG: hypothetical protein H0X30_38310 [Anaerolineae bacterium]|nr:hypothetical protein [Anaerolineae bacterium]
MAAGSADTAKCSKWLPCGRRCTIGTAVAAAGREKAAESLQKRNYSGGI